MTNGGGNHGVTNPPQEQKTQTTPKAESEATPASGDPAKMKTEAD